LILDYELPGIDGLELQRRLAPTGVPIIFIAAHDDPAVREKALASGAAGYLNKPFPTPTHSGNSPSRRICGYRL
jgi:CheY-like chemotaxis protein